MKTLRDDQVYEILGDKDLFYHFTIYLQQLSNEKWAITTTTVVTDKRELTVEEVDKKLREKRPDAKEIKIKVMVVTKSLDQVKQLYDRFVEVSNMHKEIIENQQAFNMNKYFNLGGEA